MPLITDRRGEGESYMANTWREDAIVEAIEIIADKKIAQAGYDKTIKAVINNVLDSAAGKYEIKYQDSLFEAGRIQVQDVQIIFPPGIPHSREWIFQYA